MHRQVRPPPPELETGSFQLLLPELVQLMVRYAVAPHHDEWSHATANWHSCRAVSSTFRTAVDQLVTSYEDSGPGTAQRAVAALRRLTYLKHLTLKALDDEALARVLMNLRESQVQYLRLPQGSFDLSSLQATNNCQLGLGKILLLDLGGCGSIDDAGLEEMVRQAPLLECLTLTCNARLSTPRLFAPHLHTVSLCICANLQDVVVDYLVQYSHKLRQVNFWRCPLLHAPAVFAPLLDELNFAHCVKLGDQALVPLAKGSCPSLQTLILSNCPLIARPANFGGKELRILDLSATDIEDDTLSEVVSSSPQLSRLDISHCDKLADPMIGGEKIRSIVATGCASLRDSAVSNACMTSPNMAMLRLSLCVGLHYPQLGSPGLVEANLSGCSLLVDEAISTLCRMSPKLKRLSACICGALVFPVIEGASLERLELAHCENLKGPIIGGPHVTDINLSGCPSLVDATVERLCVACPNLRKLNISRCARLVAPVLCSASLCVLNVAELDLGVLARIQASASWPCLEKVKS